MNRCSENPESPPLFCRGRCPPQPERLLRLAGCSLLVALLLAWPGLAAADAFPEDRVEGDIFLDIGDRASKPNLGIGWGRTEGAGDRNFRWIWRLEADLHMDADSSGPADLWITAAPLYLPYRRQAIAVYVNGKYLDEWICPDAPDFSDYHAEIPAGFLRAGTNTVTLRMGYRKRGGDDRELSLAVDRVLLRYR